MKFTFFTALIVTLMAFSGCTKKKELDTSKKVLNLGTSDYTSFDPVVAYDTVSNSIISQIYEGLYQYNFLTRPVEVEPLLAESMPQISPDGKTYTIKVRKGIKYQNSDAFQKGDRTEVQAQDFIYTFKRMAIPDVKSPFIVFFQDTIVGFNQFKTNVSKAKDEASLKKALAQDILGLQTPTPYTLKITLTKPVPHFIHFLTRVWVAPLPQVAVERIGQRELTNKTLGTGPYYISQLLKGSSLTLTKNPGYREEYFPKNLTSEAKKRGLAAYAGKRIPFLDEIRYEVIKESQPGWLKFKKGQLDIRSIPKDDFDSVVVPGKGLNEEMSSKGIAYQTVPTSTLFFLQFNMNDPLLGKNKKLRQAISHAFDSQNYLKKFYNNVGQVAKGVIPPGIKGGGDTNHSVVPEFNIEKAKKLLAEAGFPEGKGLPTIHYDMRGSSSLSRQISEYIKSSLDKVGVPIKIIANSFSAYLEKEKSGDKIQFSMGGWAADFPDPENFLQLLYSKNTAPGPNAANYSNPKFDKLYEEIAYKKLSKQERIQKVREAEKVALSDAVWSPIFYRYGFVLNHSWVKNYYPYDFIDNHLKYIDVDMKEKAKALKTKF